MDAATNADVGVRLLHLVVFLLQAFLRCREGIGILHDEFASTHKAIAGAELIAEFILNVIEVDGKLLIAAQLVTDKRSDRLLVRGSKDELTAVTVVKAHELLSVSVNSTTFTPDRQRRR